MSEGMKINDVVTAVGAGAEQDAIYLKTLLAQGIPQNVAVMMAIEFMKSRMDNGRKMATEKATLQQKAKENSSGQNNQ